MDETCLQRCQLPDIALFPILCIDYFDIVVLEYFCSVLSVLLHALHKYFSVRFLKCGDSDDRQDPTNWRERCEMENLHSTVCTIQLLLSRILKNLNFLKTYFYKKNNGTALQVYKCCQRVGFFRGHKIIVYHRILF